MKEDKFEEAVETSHESNLNITKEGRRQLGSAIGTDSFVESFREVQGRWMGRRD